MRPTEADNPVLPFLFFREDSPGSGQLVHDPRVIVERVTEGMRGGGSADLRIRHERDELADGTVNEFALNPYVLGLHYGPMTRCAVALAPPAGGNNLDLQFVAHGYLDVPQLQFSNNGDNAFFHRRAKLRELLWRTARRPGAQVQGRYMLSAAGWDYAQANPSQNPIALAWSTLGRHVQALPCIFNPNGQPNRMPRPVYLQDAGAWTTGPTYLFTYEGDPNAEPWTYLQALRYLVLMYLPYGDADYVGPGDLFTALLSGPLGNEWWPLDEDDVALAGAYPSGWMEHMTRRCHSLAIEGMDFMEALVLLCKHAGIDFHTAHTNESTTTEARTLSNLVFRAPGDAPADTFALERDTYLGTGGSHFDGDGALRDVDAITLANNVGNCQSAQEYGNTVSRVEVVGDREWFAVQAELKPKWLPNADWDLGPSGDPQSKRDAAYDPDTQYQSLKDSAFYARYHAHGDDFLAGEYALVGRLWGLDPAGELDAASYNRTAGPFNDYATPWETPQHADQVRRRRLIRAMPTVDGKAPLDVVVEFSVDAGTTWYPLKTRVRIVPEATAIYFNAPDPLLIGSELLRRLDEAGSPAGVVNFYDAYLQHQLRIRAVFQVELDSRLQRIVETADSPLAAHQATALIVRDSDFKLDDVSAEVVARPEIFDAIDDRDDRGSARRFAEGVLADRAGATWSGRVTVPWLELDRYPLGQPIAGIQHKLGGQVDIPFGGSATRLGFYPTVVQRILKNGDGGVATELVLSDHRLARHTGPRESN
jgi:hypothetical protein